MFGLSIETLKRMQRDDVFGECKRRTGGNYQPCKALPDSRTCGDVCIWRGDKIWSRKETVITFFSGKRKCCKKVLYFRISKVFSIGDVLYRKNNKYVVDIPGEDEAIRILQAMKYLSQDRMPITFNGLVNPLIIQKNCCKRAFLRGAFLCAGSISDPEKFYHFEIVCTSSIKAEQLQETLHSFEVEAKTVSRKKHEVVYVKEGAQIVELLGIMGAGVSLMNLENVRILKEMRNSVNRKVNCEAANINKTVSASVKQTQDIRYIQDTVGLQTLPDNLKAVAELRLKYQDASLKELGERLNPRVGKSGVNHRLRKIGRIAEELRGSKEEQV